MRFETGWGGSRGCATECATAASGGGRWGLRIRRWRQRPHPPGTWCRMLLQAARSVARQLVGCCCSAGVSRSGKLNPRRRIGHLRQKKSEEEG